MKRKLFFLFLAVVLSLENYTARYLYAAVESGPDSHKDRYLTLIYPVRGRNLWRNPSDLKQITDLTGVLKDKKLTATFLLQYDALNDKEINERVKICSGCEIGVFLEVSEPLATEASVPYLIGQGHWARPDMVFFSGYRITERERLADRIFEEFRKNFDYYPKTVGAWYIDPYTLEYVVNKYGVTATVMVADQYDTDAQRFWGKPWGTPFYPRRFNNLMPASTIENKLEVVELQWAQRHPTDGYGNGIWFSQNSLQANDYRNNSKTTEYFREILNYYLDISANPFGQVTVGLEVGQELVDFTNEHLRQLDVLSQIAQKKNLKSVTVSDFSAWYRQEFPGLSPTTHISDGTTTWINGPCFRLGLRNDGETFDTRIYVSKKVPDDYFFQDRKIFLDREVPFTEGGVSTVSDNCHISLDQRKTAVKIFLIKLTETIKDKLAIIKTSVIDGRRIIGVQTGKEALYGFWDGHGWGTFSFPFQTLARFQSL